MAARVKMSEKRMSAFAHFLYDFEPQLTPATYIALVEGKTRMRKRGFGIGGGVLFGCDADTDRRRAHVNPRFAFPHKIFLTFATPGLNISCRPSLLRANLKDGYSVKDCLRFSIILSHCPSMMWQLSATSRDGKHTSYLSILVHRHII